MNELTQSSVINCAACLAMIGRACMSLFRKISPRFTRIMRHSSMVLSSNRASVMNREKSSQAETTAVIGCSVFRMEATADWMVLFSSWIVSTGRGDRLDRVWRIRVQGDLHFEFWMTWKSVLMAATPAEMSGFGCISLIKWLPTSGRGRGGENGSGRMRRGIYLKLLFLD